jgi:ABC-type branched-subunit amino acid transport system ATPase component
MVYAAGIVIIMIFMPSGIAGLVKNLPVSLRLQEWWRNGSAADLQGATTTSAEKDRDTTLLSTLSDCTGTDEVLLTVKGLAKYFGGLRAVDGVDMEIRRGKIHALIGPNGSGKTTILNMLSGLYVPTSGEILLEGKAINGQKSYHITSQGMARTFQNIRLFSELSVLENVLIGQHGHTRSGLLTSLFHLPSQKTEEAAMRKKALEMLSFVGLNGKEFALANSLPYGQQRLLELARALASDPKLLLLDEPAAGLNAAETEELVELLFLICKRGITILLVEHDMSLVMNVSDHITVLNFGKKIAEGPAEEVEQNPEVIDAYLGREVSYA